MSNFTFKKYLSSLTKKDLTEIRQYWEFGGISQLNKAELVEALDERIKSRLYNWLKYQIPKNIEFLKKVIDEQSENIRVEVTFKDIIPPALYNFYYRGVIDLIDTEEETSVKIPYDLAEEIEKIIYEPEFNENIKANEELITFVRGLLVYYGALTWTKIKEFYEHYHNEKKNVEEYVDIIMLIDETYRSTYYIDKYNYYYIHPGVINPEDIIEEIKMRQNLEHYLPRRKDIFYAGNNERERLNRSQRDVKKMLKREFPISDQEAENILWEMMMDIKNDLNSIVIFQNFADDYEFKSKEQTDKFLNKINIMHNNTRMWVLKGHTPTEMFEEEKKHLQRLPEKEYRPGSVGEQTVVKGEQVGRNDPCPCGSGKKYKKCCLGKEN